MSDSTRRARALRARRGFTLIEIAIALAIVGVLSATAIPVYRNYEDRQQRKRAIADLVMIQAAVKAFDSEFGVQPNDLIGVVDPGLVDPWGNSYWYLNLQSGDPSVIGQARKDKNLVPINSDFDLYSKGKDGESAAPLTAPKSHDDIVRANDGSFIGLAADY